MCSSEREKISVRLNKKKIKIMKKILKPMNKVLEPINVNFPNIMLDIETMGTGAYSSIVSIGAVEFNLVTGKTKREFTANIDLQSCIDMNLKVNGGTIMWWLEKSKEARERLTKRESIPIKQALKEFQGFCTKKHYIWGKSPRFDCGILGDAYEKTGMKSPWDFRKERDVRTLEALAPNVKKQCTFEGTPHNDLDDCKHQIKYCSQIYNKIKL